MKRRGRKIVRVSGKGGRREKARVRMRLRGSGRMIVSGEAECEACGWQLK